MVDFADVAERMTHTPRQWLRVAVNMPGFNSSLFRLSRYEAEVIVASRMKVEPYWLLDLLGAVDNAQISGSHTEESWRQFLLCPAAAPVLRARYASLTGVSSFELLRASTLMMMAPSRHSTWIQPPHWPSSCIRA